MAQVSKKPAAKQVVQRESEVLDLREFISDNNIATVYPKVLENVNGYAYVCFQKKDGTVENVYFSKNAAQTVSAGDTVDKQFISRFKLLLTWNAQGEERVKFGTSTAVDVDDLF